MIPDSPNLFIEPAASMREAITRINRNQKGIVLVVDQEGRLLETITDGDVRRALLAGKNLDVPVSELMASKTVWSYSQPITAPVGTETAVLLHLMQEKVLRHVPLLDPDGHVVDLVTIDDLLADQALPMQAVIMAGGSGHRLRPLTEDLPKPMLTVGDRPLMERMIEQLRQVGIRRVNITTFHKSEKITDHFGDGSNFG